MNILVTGAGGFIGKYLVTRLNKDGHRVFAHRSCDGNLLDRGSLKSYEDIDIVYHLAAKTHVANSWETPHEYISDNNEILTNVLDFCRLNHSKMVFVSTYLYGEPEYLPVDEKHKCVTTTPYHLCKKIGEDICEFYSRSYGVDIAVIRPFNVYGKGQDREFLLPKVYYQAADIKYKTIEVFNLAPKRDYVYVEDFADILARICPHIFGYEIYNVGSGKSYSVREAIDIIQNELGTSKPVIEKYALRRGEVMDCYADTSLIESMIGRIDITPFEGGIHKWHLLDNIV